MKTKNKTQILYYVLYSLKTLAEKSTIQNISHILQK